MTGRLSAEEAAAALARAEPIPTGRPSRDVRSVLVGLDVGGSAAEVRLGSSPTLVLFLSTTCDGCAELAELVRTGVEGVAVVGVLRVPDGGLPSEAVSAFTGNAGCWLLGDDAFDALGVGAAPFLSLVDGLGRVQVEGVAFGRDHVVALCASAPRGAPPRTMDPT